MKTFGKTDLRRRTGMFKEKTKENTVSMDDKKKSNDKYAEYIRERTQFNT